MGDTYEVAFSISQKRIVWSYSQDVQRYDLPFGDSLCPFSAFVRIHADRSGQEVSGRISDRQHDDRCIDRAMDLGKISLVSSGSGRYGKGTADGGKGHGIGLNQAGCGDHVLLGRLYGIPALRRIAGGIVSIHVKDHIQRLIDQIHIR